ncbi:RND transporter [Nocardioides immobilis]|uniref:RND transporter n=1 Tax=Nocardioides immobilis TaxID=2049295 RepID=A0A417Y777_9ACTN|nr:MMPL family transporter [Nocardioides immobilis]RHW28519.1 RND transporter [Nocardioides immobilis]
MRPARLLGLLVVAAIAVAVVVTGLAQIRTDTTSRSLLPLDDPSQAASLEAARSFGGDPVVVLVESDEAGALLERDPLIDLARLEGTLSRLPDVAVVYGPGTVLNQVAGQAQDLLATIMGRRDGLRLEAEARARPAGLSPRQVSAVGDAAVEKYDERYGALLVRGLPAGLPTLRNPAFVRAVVLDQDGQPRQQWRFVVPDDDAVAIVIRPREGLDQAATERLVDKVEDAVDGADLDDHRVTVTGMPVVAAGLGDQVRREIPVLGLVGFGLIAACYLLIPWLLPRRARLLPLMATTAATLIVLAGFGWLNRPLSLGVVAFLPLVLGTGSDFPAYLVRGAQRRQVVVAALAAAAGFGSLGLSSIPFVRDLGLSLAAGVLVATGLGVLLSLRTRPDRLDQPGGDEDAGTAPAKKQAGGRARLVLMTAAIVCAVAGWVALPGLSIESQPEKLAAGSPAIADARHAEEVIGSAGEVQILVRGDDVLSGETLAWMTEVHDVVVRRYGDRLHPVVSPVTLLAFLGESPTPEQIRAGLAQVPPYLRAAAIRSDGQQAVFSYGIGLDDVEDQRRLLDDLRASIPDPPDGVTVDLAGLPVVTARSYELVSAHRYLESVVGITAAGLVLLVGLRRRSDALRAVLAAALATGWGFAGAWALGVPLTPLTIALGSMATATACEFTVLLGTATGSQAKPLRRSVLVAALAAASGYIALTFSGLAVIRDFGLFLAATVALSLLAAHVVRLALPSRRAAASVAPETQISKEEVLV